MVGDFDRGHASGKADATKRNCLMDNDLLVQAGLGVAVGA